MITGRKNIFELLSERYNLVKEIEKINRLYTADLVSIGYPVMYSLEMFVDEYCLDQWKQCGTALTCDDLRETLEIDRIITTDKLTYEDVLVYIEYILNMIKVCEIYMSKDSRVKFHRNILKLKGNIEIILNHLNYQQIYLEEEEKVLLVQKDKAAFAVAEIVSNDDALKVLEYNHYLLAGNLNRKREILKAMADIIEPIRTNLEKSLSSDFGFLVNSINIRHNNMEGSHKKKFVANMDKETLEYWYDETYQLMLYCILQNEQKERAKRILDLKKQVN